MDDFIGNQEKKSWHVTRAPRENKRKEQMAENIITDLASPYLPKDLQPKHSAYPTLNNIILIPIL